MKSFVIWTLVLLAGILCPSINAEDENANLGTQVQIDDYPSVAQVEIRVGLIWVQQCACTILTSRHVLSAAICFSGDLYVPENRRIRAGTSYRGDGGSVVAIDREYNHPDYNDEGDSNISVVRLNTPFTLGGAIQQASIPGPGTTLPIGLPLVLVGWGNTAQGAYGNSSADNNLYSLELYTSNFNLCVDQYSDLETPAKVTYNMFCAGLDSTTGRDVDARDVGAPQYYENIVVGFVAFGESDYNNTLPVINIAVSSFTEWIVETARF